MDTREPLRRALDDATRLIREGRIGRALLVLVEIVRRAPHGSEVGTEAERILRALPYPHAETWLPPELTWQQKYLNWKLVTVIVFLVLTTTSALIAQQQTMWLATFINLMLTFMLGFVVNEWIQNAKSSGEVRQKALEISARVDEEMRRMASELDQIVSTLGEIAIDPKNEPLPKTTTHILNSMLRSMKNRLHEYANEVGRLQEVDQEAFVKAKSEKLGAIREQTANALKTIFPKIELVEFFPESPRELLPPPQIDVAVNRDGGENTGTRRASDQVT